MSTAAVATQTDGRTGAAQSSMDYWATRRCRIAVPGLVRRLALMIRAGLDLGTALDALERGASEKAVKSLLADVRRRVTAGTGFGAALQARAEVFPPLLIASVVAAEASGRLGEALEESAKALEEERRLRRTVRGLLLYPCALLMLSVAVVTALMIFVLPRFREIFDNAGVPLPLTTRILLAMSDALTGHPLHVFGALVVVVATGAFALRQPPVRAWLRDRVLRIPLLGSVVIEITLGRLLYGLGTMLQNGVPLLEALHLVARSTTWPRFRSLIEEVMESVKGGAGLSSPLRSNPLCPPETAEIVATAERTGTLPWSLCFVGKMHQEDGETRLRTYVRLLEPILIIMMGAVVAVIVASVMLPLFDLSRVAGA